MAGWVLAGGFGETKDISEYLKTFTIAEPNACCLYVVMTGWPSFLLRTKRTDTNASIDSTHELYPVDLDAPPY